MENQGTKRVGPLWVLIVIIIVAGIGYFAFKPAQQADAPTVEDMPDMATSTEETVTELTPTAVEPAPQVTAPAAAPSATPTVIQGDGFTATVRPVTETGEPPVVTSFAVRQETAEDTCIFTWKVENATSCNLVNTNTQLGVRNVPTNGTLQTDEAGDYQLTCKAAGGKTTKSETVTCK